MLSLIIQVMLILIEGQIQRASKEEIMSIIELDNKDIGSGKIYIDNAILFKCCKSR